MMFATSLAISSQAAGLSSETLVLYKFLYPREGIPTVNPPALLHTRYT